MNAALAEPHPSRLFAVICLGPQQFKVTTNDLVSVSTPLFIPDIGDVLRFEKVLLVGGPDFSLIGRPLVDRSMIRVEGTVVEKTLEGPSLWFQFHKRRRHRKMRGTSAVVIYCPSLTRRLVQIGPLLLHDIYYVIKTQRDFLPLSDFINRAIGFVYNEPSMQTSEAGLYDVEKVVIKIVVLYRHF